MANLNGTPPLMVPYPDNDNERMEIIFSGLLRMDSAHYNHIGSMVNSLGWSLSNAEQDRLQNKLLMTHLLDVIEHPGYRMIRLSDPGRYDLGECNSSFKEYSKKQSDIQKKQNEKENIRHELTEAQLQLTDIQTRLNSLHLEDYPTTKQLAKNADKIGRKSLSVARWSMGIAVLSLLIIVILELLKHYKVWPFE
jgi:hypothetical protein